MLVGTVEELIRVCSTVAFIYLDASVFCRLLLVSADTLQELVLNLKTPNKCRGSPLLIIQKASSGVGCDNGFNHGLVFTCSHSIWLNNQVKQLRRRKPVIVGIQPQSEAMPRLVPAPNYSQQIQMWLIVTAFAAISLSAERLKIS